MRIFRFDAGVARNITAFGSVGLAITPIARLDGLVQLVCMHLGSGGSVGYHQATVAQLFLVVFGEGWVRGASEEQVRITAGHAAYWSAGEWHAAGTNSGMVAMVLEAELLDPERYLVADSPQ